VPKLDVLYMHKLHLTCTFMVHNWILLKMVNAKSQISTVQLNEPGAKLSNLRNNGNFWMGIFATLHKWYLKIVGIIITCQSLMVWELAFEMNLEKWTKCHHMWKMRNTHPMNMKQVAIAHDRCLGFVWAVNELALAGIWKYIFALGLKMTCMLITLHYVN
jgi:hypothetical protein